MHSAAPCSASWPQLFYPLLKPDNTKMRMRALFLVGAALLLAGCEQTPKQPVMRPIPPPPPTPPPGVVYLPPTVMMPNSVPAGVQVTTNTVQGYEVTSNFVGNVQAPQNSQASTQSGQPIPQYETVPPKPGPDYVWHDGFWSWNNGWVWIPGQWVYQPPSVIIVPGPDYYYGPRYYYGPGPYRYRHRW